MRNAGRRRQQGAVIITVALFTLFLLGFMGAALDFGRLFVVKTELQTAMDSCALAAAQELDGAPDALTRATNAGKTAGNLNKVHFQGAAAGIGDEDITFSDTLAGSYSHAFTPVTDAKYAKCTRTKSGMTPWLLHAMSAFTGGGAAEQPLAVAASAVASRVPSQTNCLVPIGVCEKPGGFTRGEWIEGVRNPAPGGPLAPGQFGWIKFKNLTSGAADIMGLLSGNGQCNLPGLATEVQDGYIAGAEAAWNTRFGIYEGKYKNQSPWPVADQTGYSWYWSGSAATAPWGRYDAPNGYGFHRSNNSPYNASELASSLKFNNATVLTDYSGGGSSRRIISTAILNCATSQVTGFGCFLMINPVDNNPNTKMWVEYIGDAAAAVGNPCATAGLAGGNGGPRVPALVQ